MQSVEIPDIESLHSIPSLKKHIHKNYPQFYDMIMSLYDVTDNFSERLYLYYNNLDERPVCPVCGSPVHFKSMWRGYNTYCSYKCAAVSKETRDKAKKTCRERYGADTASQADSVKEKAKKTCRERYGADTASQADSVKEKAKKTCQERYGVDNYSQSDEYRERHDELTDKMKQTCRERYSAEHYSQSDEYSERVSEFTEKAKQTCRERYNADNYSLSDEYRDRYEEITDKIRRTTRERYGVDYYTQSDEYLEKAKKTCREHYGVDYNTQSDVVLNKIYDSKRQNGTFNTSLIEDRTAEWLDSNDIKYIRQYKSELYPYCCDFYLPDYDLYVEIQGSWTHGSHPYNADSEEDTNQLLQWTVKKTDYYDNAIEVWTHRDVAKRECAARNNIRYLEIFSCDENVVKEKFLQYLTN